MENIIGGIYWGSRTGVKICLAALLVLFIEFFGFRNFLIDVLRTGGLEVAISAPGLVVHGFWWRYVGY
jgi:hypothetical protein